MSVTLNVERSIWWTCPKDPERKLRQLLVTSIPIPPSGNPFHAGNFGDPNGNETCAGYGMYFDTDGGFWFHNDLATNNTNWVKYG